MATPASQIVLDLQDGAGYGWSERYWFNWAGQISQLNQYMTSFLGVRNAVLANDCQTVRIRVSQGSYRNPIVIDGNGSSSGAPTGTAPGPATADFTRLIIRWSSSNAIGRTFLGGVPAAYIVGDEFIPTATYLKNLTNFFAFLSGGGWYLQSTTGGVKPTPLPVTGLAPTSPRGYVFTLPNGTLAIGNTIRMHQALVIGYNGSKTVTGITLTGTTQLVAVGGAAPADVETDGTATFITIENPSQYAITGGIFEQVTHRPAGRPFGARRGRRSSTVPLRR